MNKINHEKIIDYLAQSDLAGQNQRLIKYQTFGNQMCDSLYKIVGPSGLTYYTDNLFQFSKLHNLGHGNLSNVMTGKIKQTRGYTKSPF